MISKPTAEHCNADGLSSLPQESTPQSEQPTEVSLFNIGQIQNLPISSTQVQRATRDVPLKAGCSFGNKEKQTWSLFGKENLDKKKA